jgi:hypothetical protein
MEVIERLVEKSKLHITLKMQARNNYQALIELFLVLKIAFLMLDIEIEVSSYSPSELDFVRG